MHLRDDAVRVGVRLGLAHDAIRHARPAHTFDRRIDARGILRMTDAGVVLVEDRMRVDVHHMVQLSGFEAHSPDHADRRAHDLFSGVFPLEEQPARCLADSTVDEHRLVRDRLLRQWFRAVFPNRSMAHSSSRQ